MTFDLSFISFDLMLVAIGISFFAGFVKGSVGFALPMITIAGLGTFLSPELALAGLIVPALVTNLLQSFRQGGRAAIESMRGHWRFLAILLVCLVISAQFVNFLTGNTLFLLLGVPVVLFAFVMLAGLKLPVAPNDLRAEIGIGVVAGSLGGVSGVWGPPTVMYLTALNVDKSDHIRVQGVIYGFGALALALAHRQSGILVGDGLALSLMLVLPALVGMGLGFLVQDKLDQARFRQLTLLVLLIAGLNLIRRGIF